MKNTRALVLLLMLAPLGGGCYTTKIYTPAIATGPEQSARQWFTIGGLVGLSDPAGQSCPTGLARAESTFGGFDILINVGLGLAGGIAGTLACGDATDSERTRCATAGATLVPFLLASRTVRYTCAGAAAVPGTWPPPTPAPPSPYPPPPPPPVPPPPAPTP